MMICLALLLNIFIIFVQISEGSWRQKIVPLKSNRIEVERLLGEPKEKNCVECTYNTPKEKIIVNYATENCKGGFSGWNVSANTVLTFSVELHKKQTLDDAKIDTSGLITFATDDLTRYYVDSKKGLKYSVSPLREIIAISYLPLESDNHLRCKEFPYYTVAGTTYKPVDSFSSTEIDDGKARIENNLVSFRDTETDLKMYVIIYSGDNIPPKKYKKYLSQVRNFIYKTLSESPKTIVVIEGGQRKSFMTDIFFLPANYPPPTPSP